MRRSSPYANYFVSLETCLLSFFAHYSPLSYLLLALFIYFTSFFTYIYVVHSFIEEYRI
jgi:hypothetical protein